jgi:lactoylglutathione lyase
MAAYPDFNHVAVHVRDIDASIAFYSEYGGMEVLEIRGSGGHRVAWMITPTARAVLVLVGEPRPRLRRRLAMLLARILPPSFHLGVALASREDVERLCDRARRAGCLRREPADHGPPVGFYGMLRDPDGNNFELSHGQRMLEALEEQPEVPAADRTSN